MKIGKIFSHILIFVLTFGFLIGIYIVIDRREKSLIEHREIHRENFIKSVAFNGEILKIDKLRRTRGPTIVFCVKPYNILVDSSQILSDNQFLNNLDNFVTTGFFSPWLKDFGDESSWKSMTFLRFNNNRDKRMILYNLDGDTIDASSFWFNFGSSKTNPHCREFIH